VGQVTADGDDPGLKTLHGRYLVAGGLVVTAVLVPGR
jgi:hypothetical protein